MQPEPLPDAPQLEAGRGGFLCSVRARSRGGRLPVRGVGVGLSMDHEFDGTSLELVGVFHWHEASGRVWRPVAMTSLRTALLFFFEAFLYCLAYFVVGSVRVAIDRSLPMVSEGPPFRG